MSFIFQILDLEGHKPCPEAAQDASRAAACSGMFFSRCLRKSMISGQKKPTLVILDVSEDALVISCRSSRCLDRQGRDSTGPYQLGKPK